VDLYFSRTSTARDYAMKCGIPAPKARVRGYLMLPRAHLEVLGPAERKVFLERKLGLRTDRFTVFLATGGNGANNHFDLLPTLVRHADRCQAIVICGKISSLQRSGALARQSPRVQLLHRGFSEIVHLLMQASDAIVSRGGTTTCAKALHFKCPIIFNAFGGIMPQEELTWKFFRNGAASEKIENALDFAHIIDHWMAHPAVHTHVRENF